MWGFSTLWYEDHEPEIAGIPGDGLLAVKVRASVARRPGGPVRQARSPLGPTAPA